MWSHFWNIEEIIKKGLEEYEVQITLSKISSFVSLLQNTQTDFL